MWGGSPGWQRHVGQQQPVPKVAALRRLKLQGTHWCLAGIAPLLYISPQLHIPPKYPPLQAFPKQPHMGTENINKLVLPTGGND